MLDKAKVETIVQSHMNHMIKMLCGDMKEDKTGKKEKKEDKDKEDEKEVEMSNMTKNVAKKDATKK